MTKRNAPPLTRREKIVKFLFHKNPGDEMAVIDAIVLFAFAFNNSAAIISVADHYDVWWSYAWLIISTYAAHAYYCMRCTDNSWLASYGAAGFILTLTAYLLWIATGK